MPIMFRCPNCKSLGTIDKDQEEGSVSIICECGFHGYVKEGEILKDKQYSIYMFLRGEVIHSPSRGRA